VTLARVSNLKKHYGDVRAVDGVDFDIREGERVSIIGPNGAGKTTLVNLLTGLSRPDSGKILFDGKDITDLPSSDRCKLGLARSFQLPAIFPNLSVFDSLRVSIVSRLGRGTRFYFPSELDEDVNGMVNQVLEVFGLYENRHLLAKSLPQGDKKLLDVATAFALHPKLILLDEPTSGVSTREKRKVIETIISASKEIGIKSIIQVEHDMDVVFSYSSRIIVMSEGRILADATPDEVRANKEVARVLLVG